MSDIAQFASQFFGDDKTINRALDEVFHPQQLKKDEFHTREGQYNTSLSFVVSGILRIYRIHDGEEITQYLSTRGEVATELGSLIFDQKARWHIQAITDAELLTISAEKYRQLSDMIPNWLNYERLFLAKCFLFIEDRVHSFLSMTAEQRYDFLLSNKAEIFQSAPQQYIASMLGITPETFSRIRRKKLS
jgi:CRP-like cAMP-binding protein